MKTTKRALLTSVMALILCFSMLVGTTFAWFTDEVKSNVNKIVAGNLDIELYHQDKGTNGQDKKVESTTKLFDDVDSLLWEPGAMAWEKFTVVNEGTLALKYQFNLNALNATVVKDKNGNDVSFASMLKVAVLEGDDAKNFVDPSRTDVEAISADKWTDLASFTKTDKLAARAEGETEDPSAEYVVIIWWKPSDNDNLFNMNNGKTAGSVKVDVAVTLFATQVEGEFDSFGKDYDIEAAVFTVEDAQNLLDQNKDVNLMFCNDPDGVLSVPYGYTGTLTLADSTIAGIVEGAAVMTLDEEAEAPAAAPINIVILGDVVICNNNGSAITGTILNISGTGNLTAIANGDHAYGIGGDNTEAINISGITIIEVKGGHAYGVGSDTKYYKDAPEGGAAIGSGFNGAVITLDKVIVTKAIGGSKAAAIGARYHTGVIVNIINSKIHYAEGGVSAAAIGGSRVSGDATENATTINITDSVVTAVGGAYGAGIGSGYDTHCQTNQPLCTINITDSSINATGGRYAAGVGTGYHHAALAGEIKNRNIKAVSGEKVYKSSYTSAMDIGFGVVDPTREGQQIDSKLICNGAEITLATAPASATDNAGLNNAIAAGETTIALAPGEYTMPSTTGDVTITGTKDAKVELPYNAVSGSGNVITFEGVTIVGETNSGWYSTLFNGATKVIYKNCEIYNQLTTYCDSEFINCNFYNTFANDYSVYCYSGKEIKFDGCSFNTQCSKAIKVYDEGNGGRNVYINNCSFTTETAKKAAVEIDSRFSTYHIYFTGTNTLGGAYTKLWNSDPGEDQGTNVYVDGVEQKSASTQAELNSAVADGGKVVIELDEGNYTMPGTNGDVTISGTKDTVIDLGKTGANNVTFNGITVKSTGYYGGLIDSDTIVYNNCTIDGPIYLYGEKVVFNNCTFAFEDNNDYLWVYAVKNVEFNNCTFNTMGKAILVFQDGSSVAQTVKVEGCTFNASAPAYNSNHTIHISAVSIDGNQGGTYNIILNNNTVDADFNGLWQDKTAAGNITVTVDGATVLNP